MPTRPKCKGGGFTYTWGALGCSPGQQPGNSCYKWPNPQSNCGCDEDENEILGFCTKKNVMMDINLYLFYQCVH